MSGGDAGSRRDELARILDEMRTLGAEEIFLDELTAAAAQTAARGLGRSVPGAIASGAAPTVAPPLAPPATPTATSPAAPSLAPGDDLPDGYENARAEALACTRCRLSEGRKHVVFSDGNPNARLMVVGEAPGAREDESGLPFVGPAGQLLDLLLATVGLSRKESVYICNVLKCRPPGNRNPLPDEIELCSPFLRRQIELVRPEVILAVGTFAAQLLTDQPRPLGKLRGTVYSYAGTPLVVTYHPAALLRNQSWTRATWDDLQLLRQVMDDG